MQAPSTTLVLLRWSLLNTSLASTASRRGLQRLMSRLERKGRGLLPTLEQQLLRSNDLLSVASLDLLRASLTRIASIWMERADVLSAPKLSGVTAVVGRALLAEAHGLDLLVGHAQQLQGLLDGLGDGFGALRREEVARQR